MKRNIRYWLVNVNGTNVAMAATRKDAEDFIASKSFKETDKVSINPTKEVRPQRRAS